MEWTANFIFTGELMKKVNQYLYGRESRYDPHALFVNI